MLEVKNLRVYFKTERGTVKAVDGVDFQISKGEILGLVGESGCGKTVTSHSILKINPTSSINSGEVLWKKKNVFKMSPKDLRSIRGNEISMIFQNPSASLNPVYSVGNQMIDVIRLNGQCSKQKASEEAVRLLTQVGISDPQARMHSYPHELSGGMCQRVMIAMAISAGPDLLIADEPTASLDVTIQAQIVELIKELKETLEMSVLMISHDLGIIANMCDKLAVMYLGRIVEFGTVDEIFSSPAHPYTKGLLKSVPVADPTQKKLFVLKGDIPSAVNLPRGCYFASRCERAQAKCFEQYPQEKSLKGARKVSCFFPYL